jgi:hypothetical protein
VTIFSSHGSFQVRLQALSVLVISRSSKESFSDFELSIIEQSIDNFMLLTGPADRQEFLNLLKKVTT